MANVMKLLAVVVLAAAISDMVLADADAEFKAKLGAAVITSLRTAMKIENNWVPGVVMSYICTKGKFDFVQDKRMTEGRGVATLADAQKACSTESVKALLTANSKAGRSVKTEQECKEFLEVTLSDPVLCGKEQREFGLRIKDLEGVRVLFAGAARYQALADAVKSKAQTKLGIVDKDTCPEGMKFCYQCWLLTGFVALSCVPTSGKCGNDPKPQGDPKKMFTIDDIEEICKTSTMHETQKECKAFLEHALYDDDKFCVYHTINKLSEMTARIMPPTPKEPDSRKSKEEDETVVRYGSGIAPPPVPSLYKKIKFGVVS